MDVTVPDLGDFKDVPIIEILVAPGQRVRKDETILTLESDKASMDVPAPEDGVIGEIHVKVGDKLTQGDLLATYSGGGEPKQAAAPQSPSAVTGAASGVGDTGATLNGTVSSEAARSLAAADAASQPAWPAPITITSKYSSKIISGLLQDSALEKH